MTDWSDCPGCGLQLPASRWTADGRLLASPECWQLYTEVTGRAMTENRLAAAVHQLAVDAYLAQHAGPAAPRISTVFALVGLHLALERGASGIQVRDAHQHIAGLRLSLPRFDRPDHTGEMTVFDVAMGDDHVELVREWASSVWAAWIACHAAVAGFTARHLPG